jgi:DNA-binding NarL/FixJ family response regulator
VGDGQALVDAAAKLRPDVVVIDISMPGLNGIRAAEYLKETCTAVKVVFLPVNRTPEVVRAAVDTDALGYVIKARLSIDLVSAIRWLCLDAILFLRRFLASKRKRAA